MNTKKLQTNIQTLRGSIAIPGDKSISHRSIMFGALAEGETTVTNFLPGADCLSTISCFKQLGVHIEQDGQHVKIEGKGFNGLKEPESVLDVGNSGTTIRLMMGILAGQEFSAVLAGDESIAKRPMTRVVNPLRQMGAVIDGRKEAEYTPLFIRGGKLQGFRYELPVASAQVKSAIILAGLQAEGETIIIEPEETRDHTERMIQEFGGKIEKDGQTIKVSGNQVFKGTTIHVPGDISSAAFFMVAAAITENSEVVLKNVGLNSTRTGIIEVMKSMGADITIEKKTSEGEPAGDITVRSSRLKGTTISGDLIPRLIDEIPVIALLATQAEGITTIKDAAELKVKETNRIDTVANELSILGADITPTADGLIIKGRKALNGGMVTSHGDHRIGMMLAVAALITDGEVELADPDAIDVSYPQFFGHLTQLIK
ncbi:3-phosphoshikimate 1-carboxyvinyltransferase [Peribacillus simplex]|uniref:3-phosphoshikimate 1-carboxyvinyltransferase n=2 Tax=Peribacillus TaxID=2675229 RepID=A0AA90P8F8_9BACI|nr:MULTISPECIES: 3-phosphoshikimate 1-carboxyvinyltransferase [Peribacillus]MDP1418774.1 3-phosphoshikimate 1-carboxyvinyltransferase [Peribacillus simplex]MDP1450828.1 3-phosphoshikimate 1-carboxyvinyltransferase [Peribacillus frigoritolerans]